VHALNAAGGSVSFVEIATDRGHDAFLLDVPELFATTGGFIDAAARARGLGPAAVFSEKNASGLQNDRAAERGEATPVLPSSRFGSSR
jgi:hypothetical protein